MAKVPVKSLQDAICDLYLGQNIVEIRNKSNGTLFEDDKFSPVNASIFKKNLNNECEKNLKKLLCFDESYVFDDLVIWQRIGNIVASYNNCQNANLEVKFVISKNGMGFTKDSVDNYLSSLSPTESFQGYIGNCYVIASIMAIAINKKLISWIIPIDNAFEENIRVGAYHFRFWDYDRWTEVVVDDYLPTTKSNHLLFCHNQKYRNLFWPSLIEKAFAKFSGSYESMFNGGFSCDSLFFLSGGIYDEYKIKKEVINENDELYDIDKKVLRKKLSIAITNSSVGLKTFRIEIDQLWHILTDALSCEFPIQTTIFPSNVLNHPKLTKRHAYIMTAVKQLKNNLKQEANEVRYIKIHNPYNVNESYKSSSEYQVIQQLIQENKLDETNNGEFWIKYANFLQYYDEIIVYNVFPRDRSKLNNMRNDRTSLSTIYTKWNILTFNGKLSGQKDMIQTDYYEFSLKTSSRYGKSNIIIQVLLKRLEKTKLNTDKNNYNDLLAIHYVAEYKQRDCYLFNGGLQCVRIITDPSDHFNVNIEFSHVKDTEYMFRLFTAEDMYIYVWPFSKTYPAFSYLFSFIIQSECKGKFVKTKMDRKQSWL